MVLCTEYLQFVLLMRLIVQLLLYQMARRRLGTLSVVVLMNVVSYIISSKHNRRKNSQIEEQIRSRFYYIARGDFDVWTRFCNHNILLYYKFHYKDVVSTERKV
jgi:hypothetical protein